MNYFGLKENHLNLYDAGREVPVEAKKTIAAGRLKGFTDINPMWRLFKLTELFGPCGIGWAYEITGQRVEPGAGGELVAVVDVALTFLEPDSGEWSRPIPGTGGSMLVASEKNGLRTSDEAFKMALTDALSVACKAIGIGADVYWEKGASKYNQQPTGGNGAEPPPAIVCTDCGKRVTSKKAQGVVYTPNKIKAISEEKYGSCLCWDCMGLRAKKQKAMDKVRDYQGNG